MSKRNSGGFDQAVSPKAMSPKLNGNNHSNKNKGAFPRPGENAGNVRYCFHCGKPGHVMKSCDLWQQKQAVKPANVKRVGVLSENSITSHANEPLAHHGSVCGTITKVTGMTGGDDVGVFDVRHDEVTSGHSVNTGEATTMTNGPVSMNRHLLQSLMIGVARVAAVALLATLLVAACHAWRAATQWWAMTPLARLSVAIS